MAVALSVNKRTWATEQLELALNEYMKKGRSTVLEFILPDMDFNSVQDNQLSSALKAIYAYQTKEYKEFFSIITRGTFKDGWLYRLRHMWNTIIYKQALNNGAVLSLQEKRRIRRKKPFPHCGTQQDRDVRLNGIKVLRAFYINNKYPTKREKDELAARASFSIKQVNEWFKNKRTRELAVQKKETNQNGPHLKCGCEEQIYKTMHVLPSGELLVKNGLMDDATETDELMELDDLDELDDKLGGILFEIPPTDPVVISNNEAENAAD